jgi:hypothetical protein
MIECSSENCVLHRGEFVIDFGLVWLGIDDLRLRWLPGFIHIAFIFGVGGILVDCH